MTDKEKALLEVMNSKDLSDEAKLYIVQNLNDNKAERTTIPVTQDDDLPWSNIRPRVYNPEASLDGFPTMSNVEKLFKS